MFACKAHLWHLCHGSRPLFCMLLSLLGSILRQPLWPRQSSQDSLLWVYGSDWGTTLSNPWWTVELGVFSFTRLKEQELLPVNCLGQSSLYLFTYEGPLVPVMLGTKITGFSKTLLYQAFEKRRRNYCVVIWSPGLHSTDTYNLVVRTWSQSIKHNTPELPFCFSISWHLVVLNQLTSLGLRFLLLKIGL